MRISQKKAKEFTFWRYLKKYIAEFGHVGKQVFLISMNVFFFKIYGKFGTFKLEEKHCTSKKKMQIYRFFCKFMKQHINLQKF